MGSDSKVLVCGAYRMVGSAIVRNLESKEYINIIKGTRDIDWDTTKPNGTPRKIMNMD